MQRVTEEVRSEPRAQPGMAVPQNPNEGAIAEYGRMRFIKLSLNSLQKGVAGRIAAGFGGSGEFAQLDNGNGAVC